MERCTLHNICLRSRPVSPNVVLMMAWWQDNKMTRYDDRKLRRQLTVWYIVIYSPWAWRRCLHREYQYYGETVTQWHVSPRPILVNCTRRGENGEIFVNNAFTPRILHKGALTHLLPSASLLAVCLESPWPAPVPAPRSFCISTLRNSWQ